MTLKRIYSDKVKPAPLGKLTPHEADDLLYLQYTSGSTSAPKGVMVTYGNLMGCIGQCLEIFDFQHTKNNLASWVPFYHNIGLIVAIFCPSLPIPAFLTLFPPCSSWPGPPLAAGHRRLQGKYHRSAQFRL